MITENLINQKLSTMIQKWAKYENKAQLTDQFYLQFCFHFYVPFTAFSINGEKIIHILQARPEIVIHIFRHRQQAPREWYELNDVLTVNYHDSNRASLCHSFIIEKCSIIYLYHAMFFTLTFQKKQKCEFISSSTIYKIHREI